jgi:hypothetical protein
MATQLNDFAFGIPAVLDSQDCIALPESRGLTIREYAAIHIMAGLAACNMQGGDGESHANVAVKFADALIAKLNGG